MVGVHAQDESDRVRTGEPMWVMVRHLLCPWFLGVKHAGMDLTYPLSMGKQEENNATGWNISRFESFRCRRYFCDFADLGVKVATVEEKFEGTLIRTAVLYAPKRRNR